MIHCGTSGIDYFSNVGLQHDVREEERIKLRSVSDLGSHGPIEVSWKSDGESFVDFSDTTLEISVKFTGTGKEVAPVNIFLANMFHRITVELNNNSNMSNASVHHGYDTSFKLLSTHSAAAKRTWLLGQLFYSDKEGMHDKFEVEEKGVKTYPNRGYDRRADLVNNSTNRQLQLVGKIFVDLASCSQYLIPGVDIRMVFYPSDAKFCLLSGLTIANFDYEITDFNVSLRALKLESSVVDAIEHQLSSKPARFDYLKTDIYRKLLPSNSKNVIEDQVSWHQMPARMVLGLVSEEAYSGKYNKNPLNFHHYNMTRIVFYINNKPIAYTPLKLDFKQPYGAINAYISSMKGSGHYATDFNNAIDLKRFNDGYTLICFRLTPESTDCFTKPIYGNMKIEIEFDKPLKENVMLQLWAEFESHFYIDKHRMVITP